MIYKKLHISLIFSNLVKSKPLSTNPRMCNLYTKFVKILEICKQFSHNLVNEQGNIPRRGPMLIFWLSGIMRFFVVIILPHWFGWGIL